MNNYDELFEDAENNYERGGYQTALEFFEKALTIRYSKDCINYIACCYLKLGKLTKAQSILQDLVLNNPNWEKPLINLGRVNLAMGDRDKALEFFESVAKVEPNSVTCTTKEPRNKRMYSEVYQYHLLHPDEPIRLVDNEFMYIIITMRFRD
ncbi:tetratricopeptide repeat protein [Paenibacillus sp. FSL H7-0357]|uniref:tetratricopeptide repeat protein n=1 Tax=Paenibacillus sp. FSL H7-0357 TaxID=1536774 RepID=UPI00068EEB3E|nr:tetratricopeptide repeat protein [Paenibacillus sp. FSL H7-0357]